MQESLTENRLGRGVDMLAALYLEFESPKKLSNTDEKVAFCKVYTWPNTLVRLGRQEQMRPCPSVNAGSQRRNALD